MNQHSVRLRLKTKDINPYYLSVFLNSFGGLIQTERESYGATREALPYYCLKKIIIPNISMTSQLDIEQQIKFAENTLQESKTLIVDARNKVEQMILRG